MSKLNEGLKCKGSRNSDLHVVQMKCSTKVMKTLTMSAVNIGLT